MAEVKSWRGERTSKLATMANAATCMTRCGERAMPRACPRPHAARPSTSPLAPQSLSLIAVCGRSLPRRFPCATCPSRPRTRCFGVAGDFLLVGGRLRGGERVGVGRERLREDAVDLVGPAAVVLDDLVGDFGHGAPFLRWLTVQANNVSRCCPVAQAKTRLPAGRLPSDPALALQAVDVVRDIGRQRLQALPARPSTAPAAIASPSGRPARGRAE